MTWWRHNSSLFTRLPIHRYAQHVLRDKEAVLRTHVYSRSDPRSARYEESPNDDKHPEDVSDLQWMQLQQYRRWRKRLHEDPYKALFGASEDMLNGKGLKDWDWVYKSFPRWMLNDVDEGQGANKDTTTQHGSSAQSHGKRIAKEQEPSPQRNRVRINLTEEDADGLRKKEPLFPEPNITTTKFERDDFGIVSPSDLRRPSEQPHATTNGTTSNRVLSPEIDTSAQSSLVSSTKSISFTSPQSFNSSLDEAPDTHETTPSNLEASRQDAADRESTLIDEFLAIRSQHRKPNARLQTVLQRRAPSPKQTNLKDTISIEEPAWQTVPKGFATPPSDVTYRASLLPKEILANEEDMENERNEPMQHEINEKMQVSKPGKHEPAAAIKDGSETPHLSKASRSISDKLSVLPQDDVDFLSAAEIRASLAGKRASVKMDRERQAKKQALEDEFVKLQYKGDVDPIAVSKAVNDQLVRRTERQMRQSQDLSSTDVVLGTKPQSKSPTESEQLEFSVDRMKRWLEDTSATLSAHFWQNPTPENASELAASKAYLEKIAARIQKGRTAMKYTSEDLERDIPVCKPLLKRLKDDEEMLDRSTAMLRRRSLDETTPEPTPTKSESMQTLRWKFEQTERELNAAYTSLREQEKTTNFRNTLDSFKRRMRMASAVCQKNAKLTRSLIWSLQARLEDPKVGGHVQANYRLITHRLLTLRDTQDALAQLTDRVLQMCGIMPTTSEEDILQKAQSARVKDANTSTSQIEQCSSSNFKVSSQSKPASNVAADAHLASEIEAHRSAMQGLSDDGYSRVAKPLARKPFEASNPLAHSLFRPFGLQLQRLGRDADADSEVEKQRNEVKNKLGETELVNEVRKAYEDTYGPITVEHRQVSVEEKDKQPESREGVKFQMLKEDHSTTATMTERSPTTAGTSKSGSRIEDTSAHQELSTLISSQPSAVDETVATLPGTSNANITDSMPSTCTSSTEQPVSTLDTATLATHYTILVHDPATSALSITTSTTPPPRDPSPTIPIHAALATLNAPAKFIPYLIPGLEVVTAKCDMLILRDSISTESSSVFETVNTVSSNVGENNNTARGGMNPIDGTTRLSPTGYVGETAQIDREFEEKRRAGERAGKKQIGSDKDDGKARRKGAVGGVVKTAIWAAAGCYVVGVLGEVFR